MTKGEMAPNGEPRWKLSVSFNAATALYFEQLKAQLKMDGSYVDDSTTLGEMVRGAYKRNATKSFFRNFMNAGESALKNEPDGDVAKRYLELKAELGRLGLTPPAYADAKAEKDGDSQSDE